MPDSCGHGLLLEMSERNEVLSIPQEALKQKLWVTDSPPAGGGRRGEAEGGEQTGGLLSVLCPPPNLPPLGGGIGDCLCSNAHDVSFLLTIMSKVHLAPARARFLVK